MNTSHVSNYEYKAKQYAEETITNKEKEQYFLDGVRWAFESILSTMRNSTHPMADDSTNKRLKDMAWSDCKKAISKLTEEKTND